MRKERESNIELLRIVLMLMIILHHLIVHGCELKRLSDDTYVNISSWRDTMLLFLNTFCVIGVNCFIFISGYYGIKPKSKTLISFFTQSLVLSVSLYLFYSLVYYPNSFSFSGLFHSFFPLIVPVWWFLLAYISIYFLSPIINKGIESCSRKILIYICVIFLTLFLSGGFRNDNLYTENGYNIFTLLIIYIIARCCATLNINIKNPKKLYIGSLVINFLFVFLFFKFNKQHISWHFFSYGNPFIIINTVLFFYSFKSITIKSKSFILKIAPLTFGIYLIHDYPQSRLALKKIVSQINTEIPNNISMLLILIGFSFCIFISCAIIERIRMFLCNPLNSKIYSLYLSFTVRNKK